MIFLWYKEPYFLSVTWSTFISTPALKKNNSGRKGRILKKCKIFDIFEITFLWYKKAYFWSRLWSTFISRPAFKEYQSTRKGPIVNQNHGLTRLRKFSAFLKWHFYGIKSLIFVANIALKKYHFFDFLNFFFL